VVVSTSGISAVVNPDGTVAYQSPEAEADVHIAELTAADGPTVATRLGAGPEALLAAETLDEDAAYDAAGVQREPALV
jgi:apolipoprotein N-acyltransferase